MHCDDECVSNVELLRRAVAEPHNPVVRRAEQRERRLSEGLSERGSRRLACESSVIMKCVQSVPVYLAPYPSRVRRETGENSELSREVRIGCEYGMMRVAEVTEESRKVESHEL